MLSSNSTVCGSLFLISVKRGCCTWGIPLLLCEATILLGVVLAFGVVINAGLFLLTGS